MKVIVNSKVETLELIDRNGINWAQDLIGNYGGFTDGQFTQNDDGDYMCDQDTYDWWSRVLADQQALQDRIYDLSEEYGADVVQNAIGNAGDCDLEDQAAAINAALDEEFEMGN